MGKGTVDDRIRVIAVWNLLAFFRIIVPLSVVAWSDPSERLRMRKGEGKPGPVLGMLALSEYFDQEMKLGRLSKLDAKVAAQTLIGALYHYAVDGAHVRAGTRATLCRSGSS